MKKNKEEGLGNTSSGIMQNIRWYNFEYKNSGFENTALFSNIFQSIFITGLSLEPWL